MWPQEQSESERLLSTTEYRGVVIDESPAADALCMGCIPNISDCLSEPEKAALDRLKRRANIPYNQEDQTHEDLLMRYWTAVFDGEQLPASTSARWKRLGFQSNNPRTDFRGGGVFSLQNMVYMAEKYPADMKQMVVEQTRLLEYPLSAALVNVSHMLVLFFRLNDAPSKLPAVGDDTASKRAMKNFARLAVDPSSNAFEELFVACSLKMQESWKALVLGPPSSYSGGAPWSSASLLDFHKALKETKAGLKDLLGGGKLENVTEFRRMLDQPS